MTLQKILAFSIVLVIVVSCAPGEHPSDTQMFQLRGKVKSFTEQHYEVSVENDTFQKGDPIAYNFNMNISFDRNGNIEKRAYYNEAQELQETSVVKSENNKVAEETRYDSEGNIMGTFKILEYTNRKMHYQELSPEGALLTEGKLLSEDGILVKQEVIMYDTNGSRPPEKFALDFEYTTDNHLAKQIQRDSTGNTVSLIRFEYLEFDSQNNWIKRVDYPYKDIDRPEKIVIRTYEYYEE